MLTGEEIDEMFIEAKCNPRVFARRIERLVMERMKEKPEED